MGRYMESLRKNLSAYTLDDAPEDVRELYKDDVTPAAIHKVDSTRMDLGRRIVERFHRIVGVR